MGTGSFSEDQLLFSCNLIECCYASSNNMWRNLRVFASSVRCPSTPVLFDAISGDYLGGISVKLAATNMQRIIPFGIAEELFKIRGQGHMCKCCSGRGIHFIVLALKLLADGSSFLYKKLVRESWYKNFVHCVISSRTSFFSYERLGSIRTKFYSVRETWSHVIEMLRRYWLEVRFVFFTIFRCWLLLVVSSFFVFLAILLIMECYPEKNKIWNSLSSLSSAVLYTSFLCRVSYTRNLDRLPSAYGSLV